MPNRSHAVNIRFGLSLLLWAWMIFQSYHLLVYHFLAAWLLTYFPQLSQAPTAPHVAVASVCNLALFGTLAAFWPNQGFGQHWQPDRNQSLTVFSLIGGALLFGHWCPLPSSVTTPFTSMGITMWTTTPIGEEILFRGFLHAYLMQRCHIHAQASFRQAAPVIVLGAGCFALWHLIPDAILRYGWQPVILQVLWTFGAGVLFGILRHWTGSIWFTIPVHAAGNFVATLLQPL